MFWTIVAAFAFFFIGLPIILYLLVEFINLISKTFFGTISFVYRSSSELNNLVKQEAEGTKSNIDSKVPDHIIKKAELASDRFSLFKYKYTYIFKKILPAYIIGLLLLLVIKHFILK
jgi:uncharacterized membrane protein YraQ (UPF0718 family)